MIASFRDKSGEKTQSMSIPKKYTFLKKLCVIKYKVCMIKYKACQYFFANTTFKHNFLHMLSKR